VAEGPDPAVWHLHRSVRPHNAGRWLWGRRDHRLLLALGGQSGLGVFSQGAASRLDSVGLFIFLLVGWLGTYWASGYFFANFIDTPEHAWFSLFSGGTMPVMNIALGLKVASALFLVFAVLTGLKIVAEGGEGESRARPAPTDPTDSAETEHLTNHTEGRT
jgi:hypothetical protein